MHAYNDYPINGYGNMIMDERRMAAFVAALQLAIQPGDVVLDIGTGTGIFAFLACRFGAARVYAVEPDNAIALARRSARGIPLADRITWIQGITTELELPERVDVAVGDLHGTLPFFKGNIESMFDARKRHLKPDGRLIPVRDRLYARPAESEREYANVRHPWRENPYDLDLSEGAALVANRWWRAAPTPVDEAAFLAPAAHWGDIVYGETEHSRLANTLQWELQRAGTLHGVYVWFDGDLGNGQGYSNTPLLPEMVYGRAFFPLEQAVVVAAGDRLTLDLSVRLLQGEHLYRWRTVVTASDGQRKASFDQSTFKSRIAEPESLQRSRPDYAPVLGPDGEVARAVLGQMGSGATLQQIADQLTQAFPSRFPDPRDALEQVTRLTLKYGADPR